MAIDTSRPVFCGLTNHAVTATITVANEATGHPKANMQVATYATTWRSSSGLTHNIDLNLGTFFLNLECYILWGCNVTDAATIRVLSDDDAGFPTPQFDSGTIVAVDQTYPAAVADAPPWGRPVVVIPSSTKSGRHVRFTLDDTTNPDGYLEVAFITVGPVVQIGALMQFGGRPGMVGAPGLDVAASEQDHAYEAATEAERRRGLSVARAMRQAGRFGCVPRPASRSTYGAEAILARGRGSGWFTETSFLVAGGVRWRQALQLVEVTD